MVDDSPQRYFDYDVYREWRHNSYLMIPLSLILLVYNLTLLIVLGILKIPLSIVGYFVIQKSNNWFVEFLYPFSIMKYAHLGLMRFFTRSSSSNSGSSSGSGRESTNHSRKSHYSHSRVIEQRIEVIPDKVYIHAIPQFMDNYAYLIVILSTTHHSLGGIKQYDGYVIDCGDFPSYMENLEYIQDVHYMGNTIRLRKILCTHKHHDHISGVVDLLKKFSSITQVCGAPMEHIPHLNKVLKDGDIFSLQKESYGDVNIEVIAMPSHTRGHLAFKLFIDYDNQENQYDTNNTNNSNGNDDECDDSNIVHHVFTGDSMFSGGAGIPFEADYEGNSSQTLNNLDKVQKRKNNRKRGSSTLLHNKIKPTQGTYSVERCLANFLTRTSSKTMIYPGHEYTQELLARQITSSSQNGSNDSKNSSGSGSGSSSNGGSNMNNFNESPQWHKLPPHDFFELVNHYYVCQHKRTLPRGAKLSTVPSTLQRELKINPYYRNLHQKAKHFIIALKIWYKHISRKNIPNSTSHLIQPSNSFQNNNNNNTNNINNNSKINHTATNNTKHRLTSATRKGKSHSTSTQWNINYEDTNYNVFTTLYTQDIQSLSSQLRLGQISPIDAAAKLESLGENLKTPVVYRRPVPNTLPSEKSIYLGLVALILLGSPPCALTFSDAHTLNLEYPHKNSDYIMIRKSHLKKVLTKLGVLHPNNHYSDESKMIDLLWEQASYHDSTRDMELTTAIEDELNNGEEQNDELELGFLKLELYRISENSHHNNNTMQGAGGGNIVCCGSNTTGTGTIMNKGPKVFETRPEFQQTNEMLNQKLKKMKQSHNELLRHEADQCVICQRSSGCVNFLYDEYPYHYENTLNYMETNDTIQGNGISETSELDIVTNDFEIVMVQHQSSRMQNNNDDINNIRMHGAHTGAAAAAAAAVEQHQQQQPIQRMKSISEEEGVELLGAT